MTTNEQDDSLPALQGLEHADWLTPATTILARQTNDLVRTIAEREMDADLSPFDFAKLLFEAACRAENDAAPRS